MDAGDHHRGGGHSCPEGECAEEKHAPARAENDPTGSGQPHRQPQARARWRHAREVAQSRQWSPKESLPPAFGGATLPLPVTTYAARGWLALIILCGLLSISQGRLNPSQVLTQPSQNKLTLFAPRHFRAKQFEDERIGSLANSLDSCRGGLSFQARQASSLDKRLWILADGRAAELGNSLGGRTQDD